jgi:rubrerythrin
MFGPNECKKIEAQIKDEEKGIKDYTNMLGMPGLNHDDVITLQGVIRDEKSHKVRLQELYVSNGCQRHQKDNILDKMLKSI